MRSSASTARLVARYASCAEAIASTMVVTLRSTARLVYDGDRIGRHTPSTPVTVTRYGRTTTVAVHQLRCLWRGVFGARPVRVLVVTEPGKPDLALVTTDLATPVAGIVERYASRWSIEVAFEDAKQTTGVGEARNHTHKAVERTVPFGLCTQKHRDHLVPPRRPPPQRRARPPPPRTLVHH